LIVSFSFFVFSQQQQTQQFQSQPKQTNSQSIQQSLSKHNEKSIILELTTLRINRIKDVFILKLFKNQKRMMIPPSEGSFCEKSIPSFLLLFVVTKNKEK
jgi:hypothetical protein